MLILEVSLIAEKWHTFCSATGLLAASVTPNFPPSFSNKFWLVLQLVETLLDGDAACPEDPSGRKGMVPLAEVDGQPDPKARAATKRRTCNPIPTKPPTAPRPTARAAREPNPLVKKTEVGRLLCGGSCNYLE